MAQVSCLHLHHDGDADGDADDEEHHRDDAVVTLDSSTPPFWSQDFEDFDLNFPPSEFSVSTVHHHRSSPSQIISDDVTDSDFFDRENQVNFVIDLFHQRVEQSSLDPNNLDPDDNFGLIEENDDLGLDNFELDLGLGLGFSIDSPNEDDNNSGFMVADCGDDVFVSRRASDAVSESGESSLDGADCFMSGLRVVDIDSDIEERGNDGEIEDDEGSSVRICLDSFHLEDGRDLSTNEVFEWEDIDGRMDEMEALSMFFEAEGDDNASVVAVREEEEVGGGERNQTMANLEWEVVLNVHNLVDHRLEYDEEGDDGYFDHDEYTTAEYETLFGQFAEMENASMGRPPASKTVVENLVSVVLTKEDAENNNALCAICKDDIVVGERAKQLPCSHHYHGDCIVPWLGIRNTCPVCRFELPTDDPDYERRKSQRAAHVQ